MRRGAELVREDRVLAVLAVARVTAIPAVQPARVAEPPVPAPRRLEQIPPERAHVPELRGRREPARLAQRIRDPGLDLELGQGRPGTDYPVLHAARDDPAHVDEPVCLEQALPE